MGYIDYVDESPSLDVRECKLMSKQIRLSAFSGQQHKEETAEMCTEHEEAEPEHDQMKWTKIEVVKVQLSTELAREVQNNSRRVCSVCFSKNQISYQSHVNL